MNNRLVFRQGDCMLAQVSAIPEGCTEVDPKNGRLELLWGEVTTHCHAINLHDVAAKIAADAVALSGRRARLWRHASGARYLEVSETVSLTHEEHEPHAIPPGLYEIPTQMEYEPAALRAVAD